MFVMLYGSSAVVFAHLLFNLRRIQHANQASSYGDGFQRFKINQQTDTGLCIGETAFSSHSCEIVSILDYPDNENSPR